MQDVEWTVVVMLGNQQGFEFVELCRYCCFESGGAETVTCPLA